MRDTARLLALECSSQDSHGLKHSWHFQGFSETDALEQYRIWARVVQLLRWNACSVTSGSSWQLDGRAQHKIGGARSAGSGGHSPKIVVDPTRAQACSLSFDIRVGREVFLHQIASDAIQVAFRSRSRGTQLQKSTRANIMQALVKLAASLVDSMVDKCWTTKRHTRGLCKCVPSLLEPTAFLLPKQDLRYRAKDLPLCGTGARW